MSKKIDNGNDGPDVEFDYSVGDVLESEFESHDFPIIYVF